MATSNPVGDRVNRFVHEILELVDEARGARRAAMLGAVSTMLAGPRPQGAEPMAKRSTPRSQPPKKATAAVRRNERRTSDQQVVAPSPGPRLRHPRLNIVPSGTRPAVVVVADERQQELFPTVPVVNKLPSVSEAAPDPIDRKAQVLEAVRALVRPTAREVAEHCGMPTAAVYVPLRTLVETGKLAKMDTARGQEYSLVSSGGVKPSKRIKRAPAAESSPGPDAGPTPESP